MSNQAKRALVCGASQGIGQAIALKLAQSGCQILAVARTESSLQDLISALPGSGHSYAAVDLAKREQAELTLSSILDKKPCDILICNTGGPKPGPISQATEDEFLQAFSQHVLVNVMLTRLVLPHMRVQNWGRIVTVTSTSVRIPIPNLGVSNTIRAAVASWMKTLSLEVAAFGVTVNNVMPGYTSTPRLQSLIENTAKRLHTTSEKVIEDWKKTIPAQRFAEPSEIADVVDFICSEKASYLNGVNLPVDGGRTGSL